MKKSKIHKILGIGLTIAMVMSLGMVFTAAPVSADDDEWSAYAIPEAGEDGDWFMDEGIDVVGPIARSPVDGTLWAYVETNAGADEQIAKSLDTEGRSWELTEYFTDAGATVAIDIVCSTVDADVVYVATAATVWKTEDGGDEWDEVGDAALLVDSDAATPLVLTCLAVGWDDDGDARVFVGGISADPEARVFYLYDVPWGDNWTDLQLDVTGTLPAAMIGVLSINVSPNFVDDAFQAVVAVDANETFLVYHIGSNPGGWDDVEIIDNAAANFVAADASAPAFPTDFNGDDFYDEDTELFVGIDGALHAAANGGVVRVYGTTIGDFEILDDVDEDIASLAGVGTLGNTQMLAGEAGAPNVWYSWDDGEDWDAAGAEGIQPAGGAVDTFVVIDADFNEDTGIGWAATSAVECGLHITIDGGTSWQGVGLLDSDIDQVIAAAVISSDNLYILTEDVGNASEVFRYNGNWERVFEDAQYAIGGPFGIIDVYEDTVVLAEDGALDMAFSDDGGQIFAEPDEEVIAFITSLLVIGDEDWWVGDIDGDILITDTAGDRAWDDAIEADDAASNITSIAVRGDEAILGTIDSEVYYSEDAGETWDIVGDLAAETTADQATYVCFADDVVDTIYAASDDVIARFVDLTDLDDDFEVFDIDIDANAADDFNDASGIGCLDGVLYASSDDNVDVVAAGGFAGAVMRIVNPLEDLDVIDDSDIDHTAAGLTAAADPLDGGLLVTSGSTMLWGIDQSAAATELFEYEDLLVGPVIDGEVAVTDVEAYLTWGELSGNADNWEVAVCFDEELRAAYEIYDQNTADDDPLLVLPTGAKGAQYAFNDTTQEWELLRTLEAGTQYWWHVRAAEPVHSKWSDVGDLAVSTFTTLPSTIGIGVETLGPRVGATDVALRPSFGWGTIAKATSYDFQLATDQGLTTLLADESGLTTPLYILGSDLEYDTEYFWSVRPVSGTQPGVWTYANFRTIAEPVVVPAPVPQEIIIPPAQMITPNWIYAIIAIGATLAVVVIVLILRTRRSS